MSSPVVEQVHDVQLLSVIGFDGRIVHGLKVHPDGVHVLYPLGCKIAVVEWDTKKQSFLEGHTNVITALSISPNGKYVASGQINHMGFKAFVILWDFEKRVPLTKHDIHKVRVEALDFSCDSTFLFSLGGRDDGNVVVTHIPTLEPMCGFSATRATAGDALTVCHTRNRDAAFMSAGEGTLRLWRVNLDKRNVRALDVQLSKVKRDIFCICIDSRDEFAYCGTMTGDILKVALYFPEDIKNAEPIRTPNMTVCLGKASPMKRRNAEAERYSQGVRDILIYEEKLGSSLLLIGAGDGKVELISEKVGVYKDTKRLKSPSHPMLNVLQSTFVDSCVTALQKFRQKEIMVGTILCEIYLIDIVSFNTRLVVTCHTTCIYDLAFPKNYSEVYATASKDDIRVWHTETCKELLRISVPNFTCTTVKFSADGKAIISGWNDGCIRAFTPQTGSLMYTLPNAHNKGVTALDVTSDGLKVVSGGGEGQVRVWKISPSTHQLDAILKDHKGPVSDIHISSNDLQAVSASTDGSCIIWDIMRLARLQILFANSLFMACRFNPEGCQVLTAGTDRKIQYWECYDGSLIRDLEGSTAAALNSLDISLDGNCFVTGSNDFLLKVWDYNEGYTTHVGIGHAGIITAVHISPDSRYLVSVSDDGAICTWKYPFKSNKAPSSAASVASQVVQHKECRAITSGNMEKKIEEKRYTSSGGLGLGSGDCPRGENITALSRTSSVRSNRSSIQVNDAPPQIENESCEDFRSCSERLVDGFPHIGTGISHACRRTSSVCSQQNQPTIPPNNDLIQVGKISSDSCAHKISAPKLPLKIKSDLNKVKSMKK